MAETPIPTLRFEGNCPDCAKREVQFPPPLPDAGDDFAWMTRDYDGFRRFMLEELFARYPERQRWTTADVEVALVEAFAAVLDQLSDMADRIGAEAYLETARRPESVRRLLKFIGYDAVELARDREEGPFADGWTGANRYKEEERFDRYWLDNPTVMDVARHAGPRSIHTQHRMVSLQDYAWTTWTGSWSMIQVALIAWSGRSVDERAAAAKAGDEPDEGGGYPQELRLAMRAFHRERGLPWPGGAEDEAAYWLGRPSIRTILRPYLDTYRMAGQEVLVQDAVPAAIAMALSVRVGDRYFRTEVRREVEQALGTQPGGFFEPGRLQFGEDLYAADIFQALMALDGVESVCLNRFKRLGSQFGDRSADGFILFDGLEIPTCNNDPAHPEEGYYRLTLHGGRHG